MLRIFRPLAAIASALMITACGDSEGDESCGGEPQLLAGSLELVGDRDPQWAKLRCVQVVTGDLFITRVESLEPLAELVHVHGDLRIDDNPKLGSLRGLERLAQVDGRLTIAANPGLSSLAPLAALHEVGGSLSLRKLAQVETLDGLAALERVGQDLELSSNDSMASLEGLTALRSVGGDLRVSGNAALTSATFGEVYAQPGIGGQIEISHNPVLRELTSYGNLSHGEPCRTIGDDLWIFANEQLETLRLPSILSGACVSIGENPILRRIEGASPTYLAELRLYRLPGLEAVDLPLAHLRSLDISETGLQSLAGFAGTTVACELRITNNLHLQDINTIAAPSQAAAELYIYGNPQLPQCTVEAAVRNLRPPSSLCVAPRSNIARAERSVIVRDNDQTAACEEGL